MYELESLEHLVEKTQEYIANAKSENTRKAYKADWKDFENWCKAKMLTPLPASPQTIAAYLTERASTLKVASIERRLVSIRQAHIMSGNYFDKNHPLITQTLKGIKNTHGNSQTAKAPILIEDLREMIQNLKNNLQGIRDKALLLIGFAGALRRSEIVQLKVSDVAFVKEGLELTIRQSKTDQTAKGEVLPIPYGSNPETCPVRTLQAWLEKAEIKTGSLFRSINKHGHVSSQALCSASVALIVKRNSHFAGKQLAYSGHSLRAGFCTTAACKGIPEHAIMRQSRHKKSDTLRKYIRMGSLWKDSAVTKMGL